MQENNFQNILITGGNRGIGLEMVTQFLEKNCEKVFATTRSKAESLDKLKEKYPQK